MFVKCVAPLVHFSVGGDNILGEKQLGQDKGRRICIEGRKSNLAFLCGKDERMLNGPQGRLRRISQLLIFSFLQMLTNAALPHHFVQAMPIARTP